MNNFDSNKFVSDRKKSSREINRERLCLELGNLNIQIKKINKKISNKLSQNDRKAIELTEKLASLTEKRSSLEEKLFLL